MKYAIMSDIYGNFEAFKAAVSDARKRGCGKEEPRTASTISETANCDWFFFESDAK